MNPSDLVLTPTGLRIAGLRFPCTIGRGGIITDKREGDGATPRGVHRITGMLYRPDRMARPNAWALPIRPGDLWSDDPADPAYNLKVRAPHPFSHEHLRRADPLYNALGVLTYNWPDASPGKGSALFLHVWRKPRHRTEGCVAFNEKDLLFIFDNWLPNTRVVICS